MALRKRSYRKGELISTFLHNSRVQAHKDRIEKEAADKRRGRERNRQERILAEDERNERRRRSKEQTLQRRELARKKQKQDDIAARLRSEEIDPRWVGEAMLIMDEYGYGLGQVRTRVVPLLKSRIEQLLIEEERQKAASEALREQRRLEEEETRAANEAIEEQKRIEEKKVYAASAELIEASSRLSQAVVLQAEGLHQKLDGVDNPTIVVERRPNVAGWLLWSLLVAGLLILLLLLAILVAIDLLPPQYRMIGAAVGIVIMILGSIRIIRKRRAKFLIKTASSNVVTQDGSHG